MRSFCLMPSFFQKWPAWLFFPKWPFLRLRLRLRLRLPFSLRLRLRLPFSLRLRLRLPFSLRLRLPPTLTHATPRHAPPRTHTHTQNL